MMNARRKVYGEVQDDARTKRVVDPGSGRSRTEQLACTRQNNCGPARSTLCGMKWAGRGRENRPQFCQAHRLKSASLNRYRRHGQLSRGNSPNPFRISPPAFTPAIRQITAPFGFNFPANTYKQHTKWAAQADKVGYL